MKKRKINKEIKRKKQIKRNKSVKIKNIPRIKSGIKNFDRLCEGGLVKNSTNIIVGSPGSGKSIFATQFLIEGIKNKENVLYVTFEENKNQFFQNMRRLGFNLYELEKKGKFTFLNYTPLKVKTMIEEGGGIIESIILKKKIKRMVIDSITSFGLLFDSEIEKREISLELFNLLKKWDCTIILTLEETSTKDERSVSKILEFESDSIILLRFIRKLFKRERLIEILKMRGTNHSTNLYKFRIRNKGIQIDAPPQRI